MPIDYKLYPANWKTEIRPSILLRANNCCEKCKVPNKKLIIRGKYNGIECYQDDSGNIFNALNSESIGSDYVGEVHPKNGFIRVILTIAHLDHDINNNDPENLRAYCQKCHNNHDIEHRKANRKKNRGLQELF
jgi:protein-arginine kinase activator protein McsA